jgi:hypothetical protein
MRGQRPLFWAELGGAMLCGALALLTLAWKDWIEFFFRVDPDGHSGSFEWLVVGVAAALTLALSLAARHEWRRPASSTS